MKKVKLLLNLPPGFFRMGSMKEVFSRFEKMACEVRRSSHNTAQDIAEDVKWAEAIIMWGWPDLDDKMLSANPNLKFVGHINDSRTMAEAELRHGVTAGGTVSMPSRRRSVRNSGRNVREETRRRTPGPSRASRSAP